MGYLIIIVAMMIIGGLFTAGLGDKFSLGIGLGLFPGAIIVLITFITITISAEYEEVITEKVELVALGNSTNIEGSFFLGTGTLYAKSKYFYMEKTEKGAKMKNMSVDSAYIIEDNSQEPSILTYTKRPKSTFVREWFPGGETSTYTIVIPEGSIMSDFKIDLN